MTPVMINQLNQEAQVKNIEGKLSQKGIGLVEVLATLAVIAFGFLALLKLQAQTVNNVTETNQRYVASILAQDMGERIRANSQRASDYTMSDFNTKSNSCDDICEDDIDEWLANISDPVNALNGGEGKIVYNGSDEVTIEVSWSQKGTTDRAFFILAVPINNNNV